MKLRFIEPGNRPYKPTVLNYFVYDRYIRTPSVGLNTLATIAKSKVSDTLMYSEAISKLMESDILDADIIFLGIFTFNANRGYELAKYFKAKSNAVIVMGGLHASLNYKEAVQYCDYVLLGEALWITDDNFFADRAWAVAVLNKLIESGIKYQFTVQARWEVGLDDEMLKLLKQAGFVELAMGIEFIDDESFELYHKKSTREDIIRAIQNVQKHGLAVRGLFILGADNHTVGVGDKLADFVIENNIKGALIQCMYFVPGTPVYENNRENLLHENWAKYNGNTVHYPKLMTPYELQMEHIKASKRIYTFRRLLHALFHEDKLHKLLFAGEYFWHMSIRADLKKELPYLKEISATFYRKEDNK